MSPSPKRKRCKQMKSGGSASRGFTLIEMMLVMAIMAILLGIALPLFEDFFNNARRSSAITLLMADLNQARAEAIKRNRRALVCVKNAAGTACGTGTDWRNGWLVCADEDSDNDCDAADIINQRPALDAKLTLTATAAVIRFSPNGSNGSGVADTLTVNGTWTGAVQRVITIAPSGRVSSQ